MKIYKKASVYDEALTRIRWLFDEFPNVLVSVSGGKDSTVCFQLALQVAREKGRLPLKVMWIDQEAEWRFTVDTVREIMYHPDVEPHWYQIPMKLFNATSQSDNWLHCWDPAAQDKWIHPQDPIAITKNVYGTDRFHKLFNAIVATEYPDTPTCNIAGVRTEESPSRQLGLTGYATYKWATWGKVVSKALHHYTMYPLYDWSYMDIWKAIHDNGWPYNHIYNLQYQHGIPVLAMRVSNVHHETAVHSLFYLQEADPETYARLTQRLSGVDMAVKLGSADYFVSELPFMFGSWHEYRDYLLEHLIENPDWRRKMAGIFTQHDHLFGDTLGDKKYRAHIQSILTHDWEGIKLDNFRNSHSNKAQRADRDRRLASVA